jgi:exosortase
VSEAGTVDRSDPARSGLAARLQSPLLWLALVVAGLVAYVYHPLFFPDTHQEFTAQGEEFFFEANQSAGAPVLMLATWLFYRRSHYLDLLSGTGSRVGGALLLGLTLALYAWGTYTGAPDLRLASVTLLFTGGALLLGGGAALRAFWVPIVFLLFALPLPPVLLSAVIFPIQLWTAEYAGWILNAIGVQSFVQGDQILRPENTFIVIETCSGVRTVVTLMMLTVLLVDLFERVLGSRDPSAEAGDYGLANADAASFPTQAARLVALVAVLVSLVAIDRALPRWSFERGLAEMPDALLARVFGEDASYKVETDFQFTGSVRHLAHARRRVDIDGMPVDFHLGVADEQERRFTMLSPRLAGPESGFATIEKSDVALEPGGKPVRRMLLRRGARTLLSYSWFERRGSLWSEGWRQAAALDRSPFVRPEHMLAIRISTPVDRGDAGARDAEARIQKAWLRVAPELVGYAPTHPVVAHPDGAEASGPAPR